LETPKCTAQETHRFFMTRWRAMYAPLARNSLANVGSTRDTQEVTLFILSLGDNIPQFEHWTSSLRPFPPLLRPRDLLFFGNSLNFQEQEGVFTINLLL